LTILSLSRPSPTKVLVLHASRRSIRRAGAQGPTLRAAIPKQFPRVLN
jgi:hypothetical protein